MEYLREVRQRNSDTCLGVTSCSQRAWMAKDYYAILGVPETASDRELRKAYRKLAMQYHPDRNLGKDKRAHEKLKEINEAYAVLGDPQKRKQYDQFGTIGNVGDIFGSPFTTATFQEMMKDFGGAGLRLDFLGGILGDLLKGRGSSFGLRDFSGRPGSVKFEGGSGQGIHLDEIFGRARRPAEFNMNLQSARQKRCRA